MSDSVAPFTPGEYERLREIRERVDAATKGPWTATVSPDETVAMVEHAMLLTDDGIGGEEPLMIASCDVVGNLNNDAAFIAASRTDVPRLLATIDARDAEIERLSKIEERAEEVLREREDSTAAYILEGGTRHVGKPDARKGLTILRDGPAQPGDLDADND